MTSFYNITVPDLIQLQAGSEKVIINRQIRFKTNSGKEFSLSEKDINVQPGGQMNFINNWPLVNEVCSEDDSCYKEEIDIKVTIETKAHTPFVLSRPEFSVGFYSGATQSWVDVIITAVGSEQKSVTEINCLQYYNVHESVFKTRNNFSKSVPGISRKNSILVNLVQLERTRAVLIKIKVLTRSHLLKTKPNTTRYIWIGHLLSIYPMVFLKI